MFRRLLIITLMLAIPAQGLAMPHTHGMAGGGELDPHVQTPHFHTGDRHHHVHQQTNEHHHPHHEAATSEHADEEAGMRSEQFGAPIGSGPHDDDAIFVSGDSGLNLTNTARQVSSGVDVLFWAIADPPAKSHSNPLPSFAGRSSVFSGVPLFLSALSLRL